MRKVFYIALLLMMQLSCRTYQKLDFIVDNYGIEYLDSILHAGKPVKLQYPSDAFRAARPYLKEKFGRDYAKYKPYKIEIVDDSLWAVWINPNFRHLLTGKGRYSLNSYGICISMYDGQIKSYKYIR